MEVSGVMEKSRLRMVLGVEVRGRGEACEGEMPTENVNKALMMMKFHKRVDEQTPTTKLH